MRVITLLLSILTTSLFAQSFSLPLVYTNNPVGEPFSLESGLDGSLYVAGTFRDSIEFEPGDPSTVYYQEVRTAFVCRYTSEGELDWVRLVEKGDAQAYDLHLSQDGMLFVVGRFDGAGLKFGDGFTLSSGAEPDGFVWKLTNTGTTVATRAYRSFIDEAAATHITTDVMGNLYIAGFFEKEIDVDLDPTPGSSELLNCLIGRDLFVTKYDPDFNLLWAESLGISTSNIKVRGILADDEGHAYLTGEFSGGIDFDDEEVFAVGGLDIFVAKHEPTGDDWLWFQSYGGDDDEVVQDMIFADLAQNELLTAGYYLEEFDAGATTLALDPGSASAGFLLQHTVSGELSAVATLDAGGSIQLYDLVQTPEGVPLVFGNFSGLLNPDLGANIVSDSSTALFVGQLSTSLGLSTAIIGAQGSTFDPPFFLPVTWPEATLTSANQFVITAACYGPSLIGSGVTATEVIPSYEPQMQTRPNFILWVNDILTPSGLSQFEQVNVEVKIYPNPGSGLISIDAGSPVFDVELIDQRGVVIRRFPGLAPKQWEVGNLPTGAYWLRGRTAVGRFEQPYLRH